MYFCEEFEIYKKNHMTSLVQKAWSTQLHQRIALGVPSCNATCFSEANKILEKMN